LDAGTNTNRCSAIGSPLLLSVKSASSDFEGSFELCRRLLELKAVPNITMGRSGNKQEYSDNYD